MLCSITWFMLCYITGGGKPQRVPGFELGLHAK